MYFPYFRGKQYELISIRESASVLKNSGFTPIIEPVKEALSGLQKTLSVINDFEGSAIVIVNPNCGSYLNKLTEIIDFLNQCFPNSDRITPAILLNETIELETVRRLLNILVNRPVTFIHAGFTKALGLVELLKDAKNTTQHVFMFDSCGKLYQKHFLGFGKGVLIRDGFEKRANRKHPEVEFFSDLHATYELEGMKGFGDFLIVGDDYSEAGGPAYAVAIHLTFINDEDEMYVHHFKSIRQNTPTDPAGKFAEALAKLVEEINNPDSKVLKTESVKEFLVLHERGHFPGLGYVKKLSMKHHIETLADYFNVRMKR